VLVAAVLWYLIICSVLMVIQSRLEAHFGRGFGASAPGAGQATLARMLSFRGGGGGGPA
jgi:polar amino acid transport system permease protein